MTGERPKFLPESQKEFVMTAASAGLGIGDRIEIFPNTAKKPGINYPFHGLVTKIITRPSKVDSPQSTGKPEIAAVHIKVGDKRKSIGSGTTVKLIDKAGTNLTSSLEL